MAPHCLPYKITSHKNTLRDFQVSETAKFCPEELFEIGFIFLVWQTRKPRLEAETSFTGTARKEQSSDLNRLLVCSLHHPAFYPWLWGARPLLLSPNPPPFLSCHCCLSAPWVPQQQALPESSVTACSSPVAALFRWLISLPCSFSNLLHVFLKTIVKQYLSCYVWLWLGAGICGSLFLTVWKCDLLTYFLMYYGHFFTLLSHHTVDAPEEGVCFISFLYVHRRTWTS